MTDALFVTFDGGGNLPPALGLAAELERRGGRVRFLGNEVQRARVEGAGFRFEPFRSGRDYDSSAKRSTLSGVRDLTGLFADPGIGRDVVEATSAEPVDAVVVDTLLYRTLADAVRAGLPVVQLMHSFSGYFARNARGPVGMVCRLRGVSAVAAMAAPGLTLAATRPEFDAGAVPGVVHTGFVWQGRPTEAVPREKPRILVSFSTTAFPGQQEALQRTIDGLGALDAEVVVTTGAAVDPAVLRPAANTAIHRFIDHGELLPETSLVIGHGGHSTTSRALSYGVPVLVLPMHPLMDQPLVGKAVTEQHVGLALPKRSSAAAIRDAASRLLADESIRAAARALGSSIRERDGAAAAADRIEAHVGAGRR